MRTSVGESPVVVVRDKQGAINVVVKRLVRLDASGAQMQAKPAADVGVHHVTSVTGGINEQPAAQVKDFSMLDAIELARQNARRAAEADDDLAATGTDDFRAVAPAAQSFASGRRR